MTDNAPSDFFLLLKSKICNLRQQIFHTIQIFIPQIWFIQKYQICTWLSSILFCGFLTFLFFTVQIIYRICCVFCLVCCILILIYFSSYLNCCISICIFLTFRVLFYLFHLFFFQIYISPFFAHSIIYAQSFDL